MSAWRHPLQSLIWRDERARAQRLLRFAEVEADGGRDLVRAAELTADPVLRRLYLAHARDERRHADRFRERGLGLLRARQKSESPSAFAAQWLTPGERGLDDLQVEHQDDIALLAFLHLSEKAAAQDFAIYREALAHDPQTRAVFEDVLRDEVFHMNYTVAQLKRLAPERQRRLLWMARLNRLWKAVLRLLTALANLMGTAMLLVQYFVLLPAFALLARRAARRETVGWHAVAASRNGSSDRQY